MQYSIHLGYALVSIFPHSSDYSLQEVLSALSASGLVHHDALHIVLQHVHEPFTSPTTVALTFRLNRGAAHALLGEDTLARHELLSLVHDASGTMQTLARLLLMRLSMHCTLSNTHLAVESSAASILRESPQTDFVAGSDDFAMLAESPHTRRLGIAHYLADGEPLPPVLHIEQMEMDDPTFPPGGIEHNGTSYHFSRLSHVTACQRGNQTLHATCDDGSHQEIACDAFSTLIGYGLRASLLGETGLQVNSYYPGVVGMDGDGEVHRPGGACHYRGERVSPGYFCFTTIGNGSSCSTSEWLQIVFVNEEGGKRSFIFLLRWKS